MSNQTVIYVDHPADIGFAITNPKRGVVREIADFLKSLAHGRRGATVRYGSVSLASASASASKACTFSGTVSAGSTITLDSVALTWTVSGTGANEVKIHSTVGTAATYLATAINASAVLSKIVTAVASAAVVTVTCNVPGLIGNSVQVAETANNFAWAGGATRLSGGVGDPPTIRRISL